MVTAIESDVALVIAVMRVANKHATSRGKVRSIPQAIDVLKPAGVEALIGTTKTFDFFERTPVWDVAPERIRLHAVATQRAADRLCTRVEFPERDELLISSLLHDIGKLELVQAYPGHPAQIHKTARTPEQRVHAERRELGIDHALVGGVMARRWGSPQPLAAAIEHHHGDDVSDEAALVRLADMLAHYAQGASIGPDQLLAVARQVGLGPQDLREVLYELPGPPPRAQARDDALPPVGAGARGLETPGGRKGLQADCARARPLDQHGPDAPAQRVRGSSARLTAPSSPHRDRTRLAVVLLLSSTQTGVRGALRQLITITSKSRYGPGARRTGTPWSASWSQAGPYRGALPPA